MSRAVAVIRRVPWTTAALGVWTVLVFVFLFAPVVTALIYSFNEGVFGRQTASFVGFTTHWYSVAWHNEALRHSVEVSLQGGRLDAVIATVLGTIAALAVARSPRIAGSALELLVYLLADRPGDRPRRRILALLYKARGRASARGRWYWPIRHTQSQW